MRWPSSKSTAASARARSDRGAIRKVARNWIEAFESWGAARHGGGSLAISRSPADTIHPYIHDKVGNGDGTNANPNGVNANGGNIHGIGNVPGKGGDNPNADGVNGQANELETVHGGIGSKNKNAD